MREFGERTCLCICLLLSACVTGRPALVDHQTRADRRVSRRVVGDDGVRVCLLMEKVMDPELRAVHLRLHVDPDRRVTTYGVPARPYLAGCIERALNTSHLPLLANGPSDDYDIAIAWRSPAAPPPRPTAPPPPPLSRQTASAR